MKTLAIAAAAILAATLVAGAMVPEAAFAAEGSTWRTRPPVRGLKCDEVQYPNGPAKVLAGLEGRCASEIYFLAPRKDIFHPTNSVSFKYIFKPPLYNFI